MNNLFQELKSLLCSDLDLTNQVIIDSVASREELVEQVSSYLIESGGKRLRPILTLLTSKICGYENEQKHIFLAAAVELIHAATLLHDDVIDESNTRRGRPSANFEWGNKASILVGDFLFSQAFKLMVKSSSMKALDCLSKASAIIAEGEVMQLANLYETKLFPVKEYEQIAEAKTAALFSASCQVGAIIANANQVTEKACKEFGKCLGLIFQISDDMLDYFADKEVSGKNIGDDLASGNITIPVILSYNKATLEDKKEIEDIFFQPDRESKLDQLKGILEKYKVRDEIKEYIDSYYKNALEALAHIPEHSYKKHLKEILYFAAFRS